ncbi:enoyl-CoA hydratase/isomerase family protein [Nocardioides sp. Soil796]|uniref:enoyl-CoA hydratase/isomerase family protein n=1 Tax=Nocardioides sp. Soil796 TaxID=1736412 RepID=UPI0006FC954B|nr:enoyl-CoA hydratase/isomerase family protein [Nocardioides sp. Soil796]KQY63494.1 hypothetical protein ASD30_00270 [Nocardioides sp. Root140]KRF17554.1 hypothetical protein ASH02_25160 [Nocardioides sp. Soil796]
MEIERRGAIAVLRLNRPSRGNTLDGEVTADLSAAVQQAGSNPEVRGIVVTGTGRLFCAGGDVSTLAEWGQLDHASRVAKYRGSQELVKTLQACPIPVVAALNGSAAGAGVDLALACDIRVAVPTASLTAAFATVCLVPDLGGSWFLARRIGRHQALRFLLGGHKLPAGEALELGLVDRVVGPDEELMDTACDVVLELVENVPAPVLAESLLALRGADQHDLETSMDRAAQAQARLMSTPEHEERIAAFLTAAR